MWWGPTARPRGLRGEGSPLCRRGSDTGLGYLVATDAATHQYSQGLSSSTTWSGTAAAFSPGVPSSVDVTVTGSGGTSATSSADLYTYSSTPPPAPTVNAVSPAAGPTTGGTVVTVTGTNFTVGSTVAFGGLAGTGVTVNSGTSLTATAPAGSGTVDVTVTGPGGTSATSTADQFTYVGPPTVSAISPSSGPAAGGTVVTVTGTNFASGATVAFGGVAATGVTVASATSLTATAPAQRASVIKLVQSASSTSGSGSTRTVSLPSSVTKGDAVVLQFVNTYDSTGTVSSVSGGGVTWHRATQENDDLVTADSEIWYGLGSSGGSGSATVTVTLSTSTSSPYSIAASEWSGVGGLDQAPSGLLDHTGSTPAKAPVITPSATGDLFIGVVGTNGTASGAPGGGFTALSARSDTGLGYLVATDAATHQYSQGLSSSTTWSGTAAAFSPGVPSSVDVTVTGSGGTSATSSADLYTYSSTPPPAPTVNAVSPAAGPTTGGTVVTVTGTNFTVGSTVAFGGLAGTGVTVNSGTSLTATAPAGSGTVDVTVTGPGGTSATSTADQFTYVGPPTVSAISPSSGPAAGGTVVTVTGTNFASGATVAFGLADGTGVVITSSTSLTAIVPPGGGTVDVSVSSPLGTSVTSSADRFTFSGSAPATPRVMVIMMENESASSILGNASLPYVNGTLVSHYPILESNYAVAHPSLPNYLELLSGSTWGVSTDCSPGSGCSGSMNLAAQFDQTGTGWAGYMESMPYAGYTGGDTGGSDGYGNQLYAQHHDPFVYFPNLAQDLTTHVKPLTSMIGDLNSADAPAFVWVSPNMLDDMHDGPLMTGDTWLSQEITAVQGTAWYQGGGHIVVTWDEGADSDTSGVGGELGDTFPASSWRSSCTTPRWTPLRWIRPASSVRWRVRSERRR